MARDKDIYNAAGEKFVFHDDDPHWQRMQMKTFTRWANNILSERMMKVNDLRTDFSDGVLLINLFELVGDTKFKGYCKRPKMQIQKRENLNLVIEFVKSKGVKLVNVGADDIEEGNIRIILGLIWSTILQFQVATGSGGASPKKALLDWVNKQIAPYKSEGVTAVRNFKGDWKDGRALSALTDSLKPGVIKGIKNLSNPVGDIQNAINVAEREYDIPPLVDAIDVASEPDEHSMMTYISYFREWLEGEGARKQKDDAERRRREEEEARRKAEAVARARAWKASGPGVSKGFRDRDLPFVLTPMSSSMTARADEWEIGVTDPTGRHLTGRCSEADYNNFDGFWKAMNIGGHSVEIKLGGEPISGSPYSCPISEGSDARKCYAEGPGLKGGRNDKPGKFTVFCFDKDGKPVKDEDSLVVHIENDADHSVVEAKVRDNRDGTYGCQYLASRPGDYTITVTIDNRPIKAMPVYVKIHDGKALDAVTSDIDKLRNGLDLDKRNFTDEELNDPHAMEGLEKERDDLRDVSKIVKEIQDLRKQLGMPKRVFTEDELTGPNAYPDRVDERDGLQDLLALKKQIDPICDAINRLRKKMDLPKKTWTEDELTGPHALEDRQAELKHLEDMLPVHDEIHSLRKKLKMPRRDFSEDDLTGANSYPDRCDERDKLRGMMGQKGLTDPLVREIQRLRKGLGLNEKEFTEDELSGPTAVEDRTEERDDLLDVTDLVREIQALRKQLGLDKREFTEDELTGPNAVRDLTKDRDHLKVMVPLADQIHDLHKQLEMPPREFQEDELTGKKSQKEREKERDHLLDLLNQKRRIDPILAEILRLRKGLSLDPKTWTEEEKYGPTALKDRTKERDDLGTVTGLTKQIQDLRKQLGMDKREWNEDELAGPTAVRDRTKERDDLLAKLGTKQSLEPLCDEINKLRKKMDLAPRNFTEAELNDPNAIIDLTNERDHLQSMLPVHDDIHDLRKQLEWDRREFTEDDLTGNDSLPDRIEERDDLLNRLDRKNLTDPLCREIQQLHRDLGMEPREFTEDERTGDTAVRDRTDERDDLKAMTGLTDQIQKLRKDLGMSAREFEDDELSGPTNDERTICLDDRTKERDDLQQVQPLAEEIQKLRRVLDMDPREFEDDELYGRDAIPDREDEVDELRRKVALKNATDPLMAEINRLRTGCGLDPREFTEEERFADDAVEVLTEERDQLEEVQPILNDIHRLRRQLHMDPREFEEDEVTGPTAVEDRTRERDDLLRQADTAKATSPLIKEIQRMRRKMDLEERDFTEDEISGPTALEDRQDELDQLNEVYPLYNEIGSLRRKLEMPPREYKEDELTSDVAVDDRTAERDELQDMLNRKKALDPILREIQKLRRKGGLEPRVWTEDELEGPTAVEDRTHERDIIKETVPLGAQIQKLRKKLNMPVREFTEDDLTGEDAPEDRRAEVEELEDMLRMQKALDPILKEIQRLRKQIGLPPREWNHDELFGETALEDRTAERDHLRDMVPLVGEISKLRKNMDVRSPREYEEDELTGEYSLEDRNIEADNLRLVGPLCDEIQELRQELDMDERVFDDEEKVGPDAVPDRTAERDELLEKVERRRYLGPLIDELQGLRQQLDMPPREFADGELDADDADEMLLDEIAELKRLLHGRAAADALAEEIQGLHTILEMPPRVFTEEELDARDAVPKLTKERDGLLDELERRKAVGNLPEEINRLRKLLGYKPKKFPDPVPIEMVPELIEERDDLLDEIEERKETHADLDGRIGKLQESLGIPRSERPDFSYKKGQVPSLPLLDKMEKELDRLRNLLKASMQDDIDKQQALLDKLWDQLHTPEDQRAQFYRNIPELYSEEGLQMLKDEVRRLHNMLKRSKKLIKLILKRKAFIQRMLEFEVVASDPRRLFKGSKQLNKEEEFRRTAMPTLMKLEDAIREALTEFEEETGEPFMWEGEYYLVTLEMEIEERPLDPGIFGLGQSDSGRKQLKKTKRNASKKKTAAKKKPVAKRSDAAEKRASERSGRSRTTGRRTSSSPPRRTSSKATPKRASRKGGKALPAGFRPLRK